jgi:hypothetical protein
MYYIVQENLFKEEGHAKLISTLERFNIPYELVNVRPFLEDFEFKTDRKDVFAFGSLKLARLSKQYDWYPGAMITDNHDYEVYSKHYKENLLNYDSRVVRFDDDFDWEYDQQFIRPCLDSKTFVGKVFEKHIWKDLKWRTYHHNTEMRKEFGEDYPILLTEDTLIQVSMPKKITQEVRCWVVDGKIVTQSTYRRGSFLVYDNIVDQDALDFAQSMVDVFQLAKAFVIDVCLTENGWKIVECGSISCAGFYDADMQKIIMALEKTFTPIEYDPSLDIMGK